MFDVRVCVMRIDSWPSPPHPQQTASRRRSTASGARRTTPPATTHAPSFARTRRARRWSRCGMWTSKRRALRTTNKPPQQIFHPFGSRCIAVAAATVRRLRRAAPQRAHSGALKLAKRGRILLLLQLRANRDALKPCNASYARARTHTIAQRSAAMVARGTPQTTADWRRRRRVRRRRRRRRGATAAPPTAPQRRSPTHVAFRAAQTMVRKHRHTHTPCQQGACDGADVTYPAATIASAFRFCRRRQCRG